METRQYRDGLALASNAKIALVMCLLSEKLVSNKVWYNSPRRLFTRFGAVRGRKDSLMRIV